jgi:acyl-CoA synthetase (AMP-forming)/AMP-acid ligase II
MAEMTFEHVQERSRRLANALSSLGLKRGDRVAILLLQCPEALIAHLAAYRLAAATIPSLWLSIGSMSDRSSLHLSQSCGGVVFSLSR